MAPARRVVGRLSRARRLGFGLGVPGLTGRVDLPLVSDHDMLPNWPGGLTRASLTCVLGHFLSSSSTTSASTTSSPPAEGPAPAWAPGPPAPPAPAPASPPVWP